MMMLPVRRRPTRFCWIETPGCFSVNMPSLRSQPGGSPAEEALRSLEDEWYESEKQEQAKTRQQFWVYYHNQHRLSWTLRLGCFHNSYCDWSDLEARVKEMRPRCQQNWPESDFLAQDLNLLRFRHTTHWMTFSNPIQATSKCGNESDTYRIVLNVTMVWTARSHLMRLCSLFGATNHNSALLTKTRGNGGSPWRW